MSHHPTLFTFLAAAGAVALANAADFRATIAPRQAPPTQFLLTWPAKTGKVYTVQRTTDLHDFTDYATGLQATQPLNQWWVDVDTSGQPQLFRVGEADPAFSGGRAAAHALNARLGRGNNFMASKAMLGNGAPEDYALLNRSGFNHCRIGYKMDEVAGAGPAYTIPAGELQQLQDMVDWCLAEGLIAVVDPVHNWANNDDPVLEYNPDDLPKLQRIWEQVAARFAGYPLDMVVFEIMNEPHGEDDVAQIIQTGLAAIRGTPGNAQRIVIVSGDGFSTRQALIDAFNGNQIPSNDNYLIATFHYYDPRPFTAQGDSPSPGVAWGTASEFNQVATDFDAVVSANNAWASRHATSALPVYLGEFGVDNGADNWNDDRERWLSWVRMQAEVRGFSWAHWNMYNNAANSKGMGPWTTAERTNPSLRTFDAAPLEALTGFYQFEDGSRGGGVANADTTPGYSGTGYATFPAATGTAVWARADGIYIPKTGTYKARIHYSSAVSRTVRLVTAAQTLSNVVFPATGGNGSWATLEVAIHFNGSTSAELNNESLKVVATPDAGPDLDWVHVTAP